MEWYNCKDRYNNAETASNAEKYNNAGNYNNVETANRTERSSNGHCSVELHLHEVQGSVQVACSACDAHSHRFATVSSEPITLANGTHVHQITFRTDSYNGHYHEFTGRSEKAVEIGDGHVHYLEGVTTEQNGHRHKFKVVTHIEDPTED